MDRTRQIRPYLCVVVPCYNEEAALPAFFESAIPQLERATKGAWQIICVDDGSADDTLAIIAREHAKDSRVVGIRLSRNFGHQAALSVGLGFTDADYIGVADCDLQDPIEVLVQMYQKSVADGLDVCYGIRGRREASLFLKMAYTLYYKLIRRLAEHHWPRDAGDFCIMSARCHKTLLSLPEHSRLLRGLRSWVGFKQAGIAYDRPARMRGTSKYNLSKLVALGLQGLIAFSNIPLRMASIVGLTMGVFSMLFGVVVAANRLFPHFTILGYWVGTNPGIATLLCFLTFVFSILFVSIGIIGEYLVVVLQELKQRPAGVVQTVIGRITKQSLAYGVVEGSMASAESDMEDSGVVPLSETRS